MKTDDDGHEEATLMEREDGPMSADIEPVIVAKLPPPADPAQPTCAPSSPPPPPGAAALSPMPASAPPSMPGAAAPSAMPASATAPPPASVLADDELADFVPARDGCRTDLRGWAGAHLHGAVRPRRRAAGRGRPPGRWC